MRGAVLTRGANHKQVENEVREMRSAVLVAVAALAFAFSARAAGGEEAAASTMGEMSSACAAAIGPSDGLSALKRADLFLAGICLGTANAVADEIYGSECKSFGRPPEPKAIVAATIAAIARIPGMAWRKKEGGSWLATVMRATAAGECGSGE